MAEHFRDHFGPVAAGYAQHRPTYPPELFAALADLAPDRRLAWDCGTGSGQAAHALAESFSQVIASDASLAQLAHGRPGSRVRFVQARAEAAPLPTSGVDLVTVAQALHWFDVERFFAEVERVLVPGGLLAVWTYATFRVDAAPEVDARLRHFHDEVVGPHWPAERAYVASGYAGLALPFATVPVRRFEMRVRWTLEQVAGYLRTWSATNRYREARGEDPVLALEESWARSGGDPSRRYDLRWPLTVKVTRKPLGPASRSAIQPVGR